MVSIIIIFATALIIDTAPLIDTAKDPRILRASFSGSDASALLIRTKTLPLKDEYIGRVVPTRQTSILVRVDDKHTDVFMGTFNSQIWTMRRGYWAKTTDRSMESLTGVFVDLVSWLKPHNITLYGDFDGITDWKIWHEARIIMNKQNEKENEKKNEKE